MVENLLMIIGFILAFIGASFLGMVVTVYAINYWEGFY